MGKTSALTDSRRGAWIINASKHLQTFDPTSPGLSSLENIAFAGKCGSLLIKISAYASEKLTSTKVSSHARASGISKAELPTYLESLKALGVIDWNRDKSTVEVLALSRQRVLNTTSRLLAD